MALRRSSRREPNPAFRRSIEATLDTVAEVLPNLIVSSVTRTQDTAGNSQVYTEGLTQFFRLIFTGAQVGYRVFGSDSVVRRDVQRIIDEIYYELGRSRLSMRDRLESVFDWSQRLISLMKEADPEAFEKLQSQALALTPYLLAVVERQGVKTAEQ